MINVNALPGFIGGGLADTAHSTRDQLIAALENVIIIQTAMELDRVLEEGIYDERLQQVAESFVSENRTCSRFKECYEQMKVFSDNYGTIAATLAGGAGLVALLVLLTTTTTRSNVQEIGIIDSMLSLAFSLLVSALITLLSVVASGTRVAYAVRRTVLSMYDCNKLVMPL